MGGNYKVRKKPKLTWMNVAMLVVACVTQQWWVAAIIILSMHVVPDLDTSLTPDPSKGQKVVTRSTTAPVKLIYGETLVGGNEVYIGSSGEDRRYLWIVQTLGEGECDSIGQKDLGNGDEDYILLNDEVVSTFGSYVDYTFYSGSRTQMWDTDLNAVFPSFKSPMRNTCYIVFKLRFNIEYWRSVPSRRVLVRGKKVYDFRYGTTVWSNNPVLCLYDYMTNTRYGRGVATSKIDLVSWTLAADYCDAKGWTCDWAITDDLSSDTIIDVMKSLFRGQFVEHDGVIYLRYADLNYESSVMTLDEDDVVVDQFTGKAYLSMRDPSRVEVSDGLVVKFIDPDKDWNQDGIPIGESSGIVRSLEIVGCQNKQQALDLGVYTLERSQLTRVFNGTFIDRCIELEPFDVVTFSYEDLGVEDQLCRVSTVTLRPDGYVDLSLEKEDPVLYDDDYNLSLENIYTCSLPNANDPPPSCTASGSEEVYWYRGRSFTRWKITVTEPSNYPWFDHVEAWLSYDNVTFFHYGNHNTDFDVDPVEEGVTYYLRLRVVNLAKKKEALNNAYMISRTIEGKSAAPPSLASMVAIGNQQTVNLYCPKLTDPDIEHYEFRLGGWTGGVFLASLNSPNWSQQGVKPGTHSFYCNTYGNNAVYGDTPVTASLTMPDPPTGWSVIETSDDRYYSGEHLNTGRVEYDSEEYLMCLHSGEVPITANTAAFHVAGPTTYDRAQGFSPLRHIPSGEFPGFEALLQRSGSPTGTLFARLYDDDSEPNAQIAISQGVVVSEIGSTSGEWVPFDFQSVPSLVMDTQYHFVLKGDDFSGDASNTLLWHRDTADNYSGGDRWWNSGGGWSVVSGEQQCFICDKFAGRYSTEEFDLGSPDTYLAYIAAQLVVLGIGSRWQDVFPIGTSWRAGGVGSTPGTWSKIFELPSASKVSIRLRWGTISGSLSNEAERMELLSTIATGQYFEADVTIVDPNVATHAMVENLTFKYCQ